MPEHPKNVVSVSRYCPTCRRMTQHRTDDKRIGSCLEHQASGASKAQVKRWAEQEKRQREQREQPELF